MLLPLAACLQVVPLAIALQYTITEWQWWAFIIANSVVTNFYIFACKRDRQ